MFRGILSAAMLVIFQSVAFAQQPCTTDARHVVDELYRHILERTADGGSNGWVTQLQNGTTVREVVRQLAASPEHAQRFYNANDGAQANRRAVETLYRHILARQPDAGGANNYANMAASQGMPAVVNSIISSGEYNQAFGDWGVPGSGGLVFCGNGNAQSSSAIGTSGVNNSQMMYADLDNNRDGVIQRNEWRGSPTSFRQHDWNNDGVLSNDEVLVGAVPPATYRQPRDYNMTNANRFSYLDVNNNGTVDRNEWDGGLDAFYRMDTNNDGKLTRAELGTVQASSPFNTIDTNRDGRLSLGEWPYSHASFDQQDANRDGVITTDEFQGAPAATTRRRQN